MSLLTAAVRTTETDTTLSGWGGLLIAGTVLLMIVAILIYFRGGWRR